MWNTFVPLSTKVKESIHGNIDQDIANDEHHQHQEGVHGHHEGHEDEIHTNVISMTR